nr:insulinase family protein [Treponemataceae bacterium]
MTTIFRKFLLLITIVITLTACTTQNKLNDKDETEEGTLLPQDPSIISGKLENGMDYYIQKNSTPYNRISLRLVVKVGSLAENENEKGLAHFVEHMCFNGTEHFEKNSLIDYAESIGMDFGAEVNAYTSFEETVYKLEIPADQGEFLENALLILHDWASAVTFDEEELEKEKGVIKEEWRGSLGLSNRRIETLLPFELKDSPYVDRLPIGDMAVIQNVSRDEILAFYKRWYRPENMAVIITGYMDPKVTEYLTKEIMGTTPASEESIPVPKGFVPAREEKDLIVFKDVEMPYIQVQLLSQDMNAKAVTREEDIKQGYITDIVRSVLSMRLSEISQSVDAPWLFADAIYTQETHTAAFNCLAFIPKEGMLESSFKKLLDELDRLLTYGITQSELERTIKTFLVSEEQWYEQRESISSQDRAQILCNHVISGDTVVSDEIYFDIVKRILTSVTMEDVNAAARDMFADRGKLCMIDAPEGTELPQKEELMDLWENYVSETALDAYEDLAAEDNLMEKPEEKAEVVSTRHLETLKANEYVLSNGARIIVKKTDFENAKIYMSAESQGGASLVSDDEYPSCVFSTNHAIFSGIAGMNISQLQKYLSDSYIN